MEGPDQYHERAMELGSIELAKAINRAKLGHPLPPSDLLWSERITDTTWFGAKPLPAPTPPAKQRAKVRAMIEAGGVISRDPCFKCGTRADVGCKHRRVA